MLWHQSVELSNINSTQIMNVQKQTIFAVCAKCHFTECCPAERPSTYTFADLVILSFFPPAVALYLLINARPY
jgi:hypothetical protein